MMNRTGLRTAFYGSETIINAALAQVNIADMNDGTAVTKPLFMAVRSNKVTAVRLMVEAGCDVNLSVPSNIPSIKKLNISPLDVALHHKCLPVAKYLLNQGAQVPHVSEWPTNRATFDLLRDWEKEHNGSVIPTWSEARKLRLSGSLEELEY